jgi:transposase
MNKPRRHFADHEKVAILKRHLIDKVPVSDLCDELQLYPNQFYDWLKKVAVHRYSYGKIAAVDLA